MKNLLPLLCLFLSFNCFAHEGGHGQISEGGKFGGITAPVMLKSESHHAKNAKVYYKAELVRSESGDLSLYLFDTSMKVLDLSTFPSNIEAKLEVKKKGKFTYVGSFKFEKNKNHYKGKLPQIEYKPFNIDLYFQKDKQEFFIGFSNLD